MGVARILLVFTSRFTLVSLIALLPLICGSCMLVSSPSTVRLADTRVLMDLRGLRPMVTYATVRASLAPPRGWDRLVPDNNPLYSVEQWRSPSSLTGLGIVHINLPLPLNAPAIAWLARREYAKSGEDGKVLDQWSDALGRSWFDVENDKYRVRGYVLTRNLDAWIIFCGFRRRGQPEPTELSLAVRSTATIEPTVKVN